MCCLCVSCVFMESTVHTHTFVRVAHVVETCKLTLASSPSKCVPLSVHIVIM